MGTSRGPNLEQALPMYVCQQTPKTNTIWKSWVFTARHLQVWKKETKKTEVACLQSPQPTQGTARNTTSTSPASVEWPSTWLCYLLLEM